MLKRLLNFFYRAPDVVIGDPENPYLYRWHVIPRNNKFNVYLHKFLRSDDPTGLHDHPYANCSILLRGSYCELVADGVKVRVAPTIVARRATTAHQIVLFEESIGDNPYRPIPVWSLFITGPRVREWGFHTKDGWRHWRDVTMPTEKGNKVKSE